MPQPAIWMVRAALVHLLVGAALGALVLLIKAGVGVPLWVGRTWPLHGEMMLLGWMVQLAMGVGYWILPKHAQRPVRGPATTPRTPLQSAHERSLALARRTDVSRPPQTGVSELPASISSGRRESKRKGVAPNHPLHAPITSRDA